MKVLPAVTGLVASRGTDTFPAFPAPQASAVYRSQLLHVAPYFRGLDLRQQARRQAQNTVVVLPPPTSPGTAPQLNHVFASLPARLQHRPSAGSTRAGGRGSTIGALREAAPPGATRTSDAAALGHNPFQDPAEAAAAVEGYTPTERVRGGGDSLGHVMGHVMRAHGVGAAPTAHAAPAAAAPEASPQSLAQMHASRQRAAGESSAGSGSAGSGAAAAPSPPSVPLAAELLVEAAKSRGRDKSRGVVGPAHRGGARRSGSGRVRVLPSGEGARPASALRMSTAQTKVGGGARPPTGAGVSHTPGEAASSGGAPERAASAGDTGRRGPSHASLWRAINEWVMPATIRALRWPPRQRTGLDSLSGVRGPRPQTGEGTAPPHAWAQGRSVVVGGGEGTEGTVRALPADAGAAMASGDVPSRPFRGLPDEALASIAEQQLQAFAPHGPSSRRNGGSGDAQPGVAKQSLRQRRAAALGTGDKGEKGPAAASEATATTDGTAVARRDNNTADEAAGDDSAAGSGAGSGAKRVRFAEGEQLEEVCLVDGQAPPSAEAAAEDGPPDTHDSLVAQATDVELQRSITLRSLVMDPARSGLRDLGVRPSERFTASLLELLGTFRLRSALPSLSSAEVRPLRCLHAARGGRSPLAPSDSCTCLGWCWWRSLRAWSPLGRSAATWRVPTRTPAACGESAPSHARNAYSPALLTGWCPAPSVRVAVEQLRAEPRDMDMLLRLFEEA